MKRLFMLAMAAFALATLSAEAKAQLSLVNGTFDLDPDLGGLDEPDAPPSGWYTHYRGPQTWSDFRFGNDGNGGWNNNGIALGQNYLGPNFEPGPEDGYYYVSLGSYRGEVSATVSGLGYNRTNGNAAGVFDVDLYYSPGATFVPADGTDIDGHAVLLDAQFVDISALTGTVPRSQPFSMTVPFAGSGISMLDSVWLRIGDGPDDGDLNSFDEPIIDNVTLTTVVPEPSTLCLAGLGALMAVCPIFRRRRVRV